MENKKQIEEICKMAVLGCRRNPQAHDVEECVKCEFKNGMCDIYKVAEKIYEQNPQKFSENVVVLTREEFDEDYVTKQDRDYWKFKAEMYKDALSQASKETAKKIITIIKDYYGDISVIAKITEQFGLEVKND